jgi:hypothetical protein
MKLVASVTFKQKASRCLPIIAANIAPSPSKATTLNLAPEAFSISLTS